jgi:hypothetical protein
MSTSTPELLALAKRLQEDVGNEASLRCAVSRSYYAALLKADETFPLRDPGAYRGGESSHQKIIDRAVVHGQGPNPGRSSAISVAKLLPKMKRTRVKADYHLGDTVAPDECNEAILRAEAAIEACDDVLQKLAQATAAPVVASASVVAPTSEAARPALTRIR